MNDIVKTQGIIIGRLDGMIQRMDTANGRTATNETRLNKVENQVSGIIGKAIGAGAVVGIMIALVDKVL